MRVLVTGANGFIGKHVVKALRETGHDVIAADNEWLNLKWNESVDLEADITKPLIPIPGLDAVIHLAGLANPRECDAYPGLAFDKNVNGTHQVLKMALASGAKKVVYACYDATTRAFTRNGLKDFLALQIGDEVLSIDPATSDITWKKVVNLQAFAYEGDLVHFQGRSVDLLVTPNHKMLVNTPSAAGWKVQFEEAAKTATRNTFRYLDGTWRGVTTALSADQCYLVGLYVGDGYTYVAHQMNKTGLRRAAWLDAARSKEGHFVAIAEYPTRMRDVSGRVYLCIPHADKSRAKVEAVLDRLGISWHNDSRGNIYFNPEGLSDLLLSCGTSAHTKHIPRELLDASSVQLEALRQGLLDSDGDRNRNFVTVSRQLALDLLEISTKLGGSGTIKEYLAKDILIKGHVAHGKEYFRVSVKRMPKWSMATSSKVRYEPYTGVVWCPEIEDNHNLLVERHGKFVFCGNSTAHVYGVSPKYLPTDEEHPLYLQNNYTLTKILGEQLCRLYHENHGLSYTTLRLYNAYGPGQARGYFIPDQLAKAKAGHIELTGGSTTKDWTYVEDVAQAFIKALDTSYVGAINIGTGIETEIAVLAEYIAHAMGAKFSSTPSPNATRMQADISRARSILHWQPTIGVTEGLERTLQAEGITQPASTLVPVMDWK